MEWSRSQIIGFGLLIVTIAFVQVGDFAQHTTKEPKPIKHSV